MKDFELESQPGKVYKLFDTHCAFCKYCTDIFWDYTNGPYMFLCKFGIKSDGSGCEKFIDEKGLILE